MRAGSLRHRVSVFGQTTETKDGHGGFNDPTPTTILSRAAACVEALTGRELERAQAIEPRSSYQVKLRYHPDLKARQALTWHDGDADRAFEIVAPPINPDGRRREYVLLCAEVV